MTFYHGRLALVTGASEGIGLAVAAELTRRRCRVVMVARRPDVLEEARRRIGALDAVSVDVSSWAAVRGFVDDAVRRHGAPDFVVSCAGLAHPAWLCGGDAAHGDGRDPNDTVLGEFDEMLRTNLMGTVHVVKAVVPHLMARAEGGSHIVTTASLGGLFGLYGYTGYCASKFAVLGFSDALRREVAPYGIGVTVLCPPNTRTPGLARENLRKPAEVLAQEEKAAVLEADTVAQRLLDALPRRPRVFIPSLDGRVAWLLARWAPGLLDRLLRRPPP